MMIARSSNKVDADDDLPPVSAVGHGVGLAGLAGLGLWILVARRYGMDGPHAGLTSIVACGLPMVLWSLIVDKVHRRPSTGIDWTQPRALSATIDISIVKIAGLWATWALIALFYATARWYWEGNYRLTMDLFLGAAPLLMVASVPYVIWIDRYLVDPRDGAFALGQWLIGRQADVVDWTAIAHHARAWAVKAFFLAFMLTIVPGNFAQMVQWDSAAILASPQNLAFFLIALMFVVDVAFATVGYMLTMRPLDAHIRTANPLLGGWLAALICYPPFVLMGPGGPLHYENDTRDWVFWIGDRPTVLAIWGGLLVLLTGVYAWATVAFGLRFSNLTHRGIITHGPYRLTKHPAYLSKNLFWWCSSMPFLTVNGDLASGLRNAMLLALVSGVYYWRARTEEAHLGKDAAYRAYADWMDRNGPVPRVLAVLSGKRRPVTELTPAE